MDCQDIGTSTSTDAGGRLDDAHGQMRPSEEPVDYARVHRAVAMITDAWTTVKATDAVQLDKGDLDGFIDL